MAKTRIGPTNLLYPTPTTLVGAVVDGKPNFLAIAWCGVVSSRPPMLSVSLQPHRYTLKGIVEHGVFSINIPSVAQVREADYCGIRSGKDVDKVDVCGFDVFYGTLDKAPLISQCPVNLECHVEHTLDLGMHHLIVGRVEDTHISEECLTDGRPDVDKIDPFIFIQGARSRYQAFGAVIGQAFRIGLELEQGEAGSS